ncbi:MAG: prepilin-type N-terminal cleavage/methylation domain-containing protein [Candidatus Polarisedimenticolaceae bacterium]|nr:prepilin-type N-terminal cleavage/methylation domain-containing protein [Candidatus Polarisedimenticolaceae bacterium]
MIPIRSRECGFTLIEMAIVLLVIGLLLGGLLTPLSTKIEGERYKESRNELSKVVDALMGYAVSNQRLPCADTNGDGVEDVGANCSNEGTVPWLTLGAGREDAWKHPIRYRVDAGFTTAPILDPAVTISSFSIVDRAGAALTPADPGGPVVILFSCGNDGLPNGENNANGADNNPTCENPGNPNTIYVQDVPDANFDDHLIWLSKNRLLNRMVAAGKWP